MTKELIKKMAVMRMIKTIKYVQNEDDVDNEDVSEKRKTNMMEMMMNHKEDDDEPCIISMLSVYQVKRPHTQPSHEST